MLDIDRILDGAVDMHVHHGPDLQPRRMDALETAKQAQDARMKAIVLKNRLYPTAPLAILINQFVPELKVFGSICLEFEIGGLNTYALEASAKLGARVVWMPTFSSANSRAKTSRLMGITDAGNGFSILNTNGKLMPEISRLLSIIKSYDLVLATGHISVAETFALIEEARRVGIWKLIITHPMDVEVLEQAPSLEELEQLAKMGAFIEYTFLGFLPTMFRHDPSQMMRAIKSIGAEHVIISTDLGQAPNLPPAEGMRMFIAMLVQLGFTPAEIEIMCKVNPSKLLNLV